MRFQGIGMKEGVASRTPEVVGTRGNPTTKSRARYSMVKAQRLRGTVPMCVVVPVDASTTRESLRGSAHPLLKHATSSHPC